LQKKFKAIPQKADKVMAKVYSGKLSELTKKAAPKGFKGIQLEVKYFFGGAAVYADGKFS